jgi:hypothetical protein
VKASRRHAGFRIGALGLAVCAWAPVTTWAHEPTGGEWLADCGAYLAVLEGAEGSDLDITYCTGLTMGILAGIATGARIGAVSMASALTVLAGLDQDKVLEAFRGLDKEGRLIRYCLPADQPLSEIVTAVAADLQAAPAQQDLPVTAAFFQTLQARYPCATEEDSVDK